MSTAIANLGDRPRPRVCSIAAAATSGADRGGGAPSVRRQGVLLAQSERLQAIARGWPAAWESRLTLAASTMTPTLHPGWGLLEAFPACYPAVGAGAAVPADGRCDQSCSRRAGPARHQLPEGAPQEELVSRSPGERRHALVVSPDHPLALQDTAARERPARGRQLMVTGRRGGTGAPIAFASRPRCGGSRGSQDPGAGQKLGLGWSAGA